MKIKKGDTVRIIAGRDKGKDGKVLARWGTPNVTAPGSFAAPHGLALDSKNDLYVSEVTWTFAVSRGRAPEDCHTFQKFSLSS